MADTIYTRALVRAAETQGSTQALASLLRVPENTLLRWMSGRAQMPLQAFLKLISLLTELERADTQSPRDERRDAVISLRLGSLEARCGGCGATQFLAPPAEKLRYTAELACPACGQRAVHAELVTRLATEAMVHTRSKSRQP